MEIQYYTNHKNLVVATGMVNGKRIRTEAICSPNDVFDESFGRELAGQRLMAQEKKMILEDTMNKIKSLRELQTEIKQDIAKLQRQYDHASKGLMRNCGEIAKLLCNN